MKSKNFKDRFKFILLKRKYQPEFICPSKSFIALIQIDIIIFLNFHFLHMKMFNFAILKIKLYQHTHFFEFNSHLKAKKKCEGLGLSCAQTSDSRKDKFGGRFE